MKASNGLLYPILGLASFVGFIIYISLGKTGGASYIAAPVGFVERNGTQFTVDGRPMYVNGWNSYWLMDHAVEDHSRHRIRGMFQTGQKMGLTVCRTWAFNEGDYHALQVSLGRFDERVFKALDHVIAEAQMHGIRLILCLANNLQAYGGKTQYVKWAWEDGIGLSSSNDSFFFDPSIRTYFKTFIKTMLTRKNHLTGIEYKDDPTIFAWELMNEPRCTSDPTGDTFQEWLEEMVGYIKSIDNKHLLTVGLEGFYGPSSPKEKLKLNPSEWLGTIGVDFIRNSKTPGLDFASVHSYPDQWFVKQQLSLDEKTKFISNWINSHIDDGDKVLGKPVLFSEIGFSSKYKDFDHSHREIFYKAVYEIIYRSARRKRSGAGSLIWQLMAKGMQEYNDDYGIVPEERPALYAVMKKHSCKLASLRYGQDQKRMSKEIC